MWGEIDRMTGWVGQLMRLWDQGAIKPKIARTFPFDEAAAAHHFNQDCKNRSRPSLDPPRGLQHLETGRRWSSKRPKVSNASRALIPPRMAVATLFSVDALGGAGAGGRVDS